MHGLQFTPLIHDTFLLIGDTTQEQGGIVLHDSGSERGRYVCDTCGSECRTAAGLKSHTTAMHQTRFVDPFSNLD